MENKHNIILFGKENVGKTGTLMYLAGLLAGITFSPVVWDRKKMRLICSGKILEDAHFIIRYMGKLVFIATSGDSWENCKVNYNFFTGQNLGNMKIYDINPKGVFEIKNKVPYSIAYNEENVRQELVVVPDICISACRPEGDRRGAIKAIHSYSEDILDRFVQQIWIRKDADSEKNIEKNNKKQAKKLQSIINRIIKTGK